MYSDLFFVPNSGGSRREKALIDSACRAHNMRAIHRKRRATVKDNAKQSTIDSNSAVTRLDMDSTITAEDQPTWDLTPSKAESTSLPIYTTISLGLINPCEDSPQSILAPNLNKAIEFLQFHLVKSWSPTFMLRLQGDVDDRSSFESSLQTKASQWMWLLWTSNIHLFWSVVASILPLLIRDLSHAQKSYMEAMALDFRVRCYRGLRSSLSNSSQTSDTALLMTMYYVKSLFREACASGDTRAACCHSEALARLASRSDQFRTDVERRRIALWGDAVPALLQLRRPAVDLSAKMEILVQEMWTDAELTLPSVTPDELEPPISILNQDLQNAIVFLKRAASVVNHRSRKTAERCPHQTEIVFQWVTSKAEHHMCQLLNSYHDWKERPGTTGQTDALSEGERYISMSMALALLHIYQKAFFDIHQADGTDVNESAMAVLPALQQALQLAEKHSSRSEWCFYHDTIFWILFAGAWAEEQLNKNVKYTDYITAPRTWFSSKILRFAVDLDLTSWLKARSRLDKLVWVDYLDEGFGTWYDHLVRDIT